MARLESISFDQLRMNATVTAPGGVVNAETVFTFSQRGDLVEAHYAGGRIRSGRLVGRVEDGRLTFTYAQCDTDNRLDCGRSECDVERLADGRVRLVEHFEWASRAGGGTNVMEELPPGGLPPSSRVGVR